MSAMKRLDWTNAQTQQNVIAFLNNSNNHETFCKIAKMLINACLFCQNNTLINFIDTLIKLERNMFGKSLLLNCFVNFLINNSDGITLQHAIYTNVLSDLLVKYY
ncbi:ac19 [Oxyplax ochracea nucleopolyhedrovirus]|uniref:Ac19 n=1 Tax=Oxyplax ochracea nucleopolyhedrovirus TaxID=2083176 RepID=A0A2L0WU68_9ABAC|nr:ac19 [Oxyplax ochracea nucleopolyhedrovirus]AVA31199.1 ac19 [Oxyplax ochracea nucleopolyhedrovirus]